MSAPLPRKVGELFFGFIVLAFSVFLFWQAYEISGFSELSSPGSVPMAAAAPYTIHRRIGEPCLLRPWRHACF